MLLNVIVMLLIVLITAYLANQGMLSSLLALATAIFSSILAMALLEPLQGIIGGWRPDYARGVTFLLLFFLAFSVTRISADIAVPKNIKLPLLYNRIAGGVTGFVTSLVVVGTLLIGIEMLPIDRVPLGLDRFPESSGMQAMDADGKPVVGKLAKMQNVWFSPDRFVLSIWDGVSGRALGGDHAWATRHPDMTIESYGYRNHVDGSRRAAPAELVSVRDAWMSTEPLKDEQGNEMKPDMGQRWVMVRTVVNKGNQPPHDSNDVDSFLRISTTQVRLVTDKKRQHYPIGYLEQGLRFMPLSLVDGYVLDDYTKDSKAIQDWIFQVAEDETPVNFEMKQLAQADLRDVLKGKQTPPLSTAEYPAHAYLKDICSLSVELDPKDRELKAANVYVLKPDALCTKISVSGAIQSYESCYSNVQKSQNGWTSAGKPGIPSEADFKNVYRYATDFSNAKDNEQVQWNSLIPIVLLGQMQPDGQRNVSAAMGNFENSVLPLFKNASLVVASGPVPPSGLLNLPKVSAGKRVLVVTMLISKDNMDRGYYVWVKDISLGEPVLGSDGKPTKDKDGNPVVKNKTLKESFTVGGNNPVLKLDLDDKAP